MPSDYESGTKKTIDLSIQAEKITSDILKNAMAEFLDGKAEKKGRMTLRQLEKKSQSKLESIEVTDNNISDFLQTARKLDVSMYALEAPEIDLHRQNETMHILFALEDAGLIQFTDSGILIDTKDKNFRKRLLQWRTVHSKIADKESYDEWRYRYEE